MRAFVLAAVIMLGAVFLGVYASVWIYRLVGVGPAVFAVGLLAALWAWAMTAVAIRLTRRRPSGVEDE